MRGSSGSKRGFPILTVTGAVALATALVAASALPLAQASDGPGLSVAREKARAALKVQCGACHLPQPGDPQALKVYDLSDALFTSHLSDKQLDNLATRFAEQATMKKSERRALIPHGVWLPPPPKPAEVAKVQDFVMQEILSRHP